MPDRFNKKAQELLRAADDNGGLTFKSLFDLQIAAHEEARAIADELAEKTSDRFEAVKEKLDTLGDGVAANSSNIAKLDCVQHPRKPRRSYDEPDVDYSKTQYVNDDNMMHTKMMWWVGGKIGYVALAALVTTVNIALNYLWFGNP